MSGVDFDARYAVAGRGGVAFYLDRYYNDGRVDEDGEPLEIDTSRVVAVMVGDDQEWVVDVDQLRKLSDDEYCSGCGQIGCPWG